MRQGMTEHYVANCRYKQKVPGCLIKYKSHKPVKKFPSIQKMRIYQKSFPKNIPHDRNFGIVRNQRRDRRFFECPLMSIKPEWELLLNSKNFSRKFLTNFKKLKKFSSQRG